MPPYVYEPAKHLPPLPLDMLRSFVASQTGGGLEGLDWPVLLQIWETLLATDSPSGLSATLAQGGVIYEENGRYGHRALDGVFEELGDASPTNPKDLPLGLSGWKLVGTPEATELIEQAAACWDRFSKAFKLDSANPKKVEVKAVAKWAEKDPQVVLFTRGSAATSIPLTSNGSAYWTVQGAAIPVKVHLPTALATELPTKSECSSATLIAVQASGDLILGLCYSPLWSSPTVISLPMIAGMILKGYPLYASLARVHAVCVFPPSGGVHLQLFLLKSPSVTGPTGYRERIPLERIGPSYVRTYQDADHAAFYLTATHLEDDQPIWVTFPPQSHHSSSVEFPAHNKVHQLKVLNRLWRFYGMRHLVQDPALLDPDGPLNLPPAVIASGSGKSTGASLVLMTPTPNMLVNLLKLFAGKMLRVYATRAEFWHDDSLLATVRHVQTPTYGLLPGTYRLPAGLELLNGADVRIYQGTSGLRVTLSDGGIVDIPRDPTVTEMPTLAYSKVNVEKYLGVMTSVGWEALRRVTPFVDSSYAGRNHLVSGAGFVKLAGQAYLVGADVSRMVYAPVSTQLGAPDFGASEDLFQPTSRGFWSVDTTDGDLLSFFDTMALGTSAQVFLVTPQDFWVFQWEIDGGTYRVSCPALEFPDMTSFLAISPGAPGKDSQITLDAPTARSLAKHLQSVGTKHRVVQVSFTRNIQVSAHSEAAQFPVFTAQSTTATGRAVHTPLVMGVAPKLLAKMLKAMDGHPVTFMVGTHHPQPIYLDSPTLRGVLMPVRLD